MPPLRDHEILQKFRNAFQYATSGGVTWKQVPAEWIRKELEGVTTKAINELLLEHVRGGGEIKQVSETREGWKHYQYHYDFIITVDDKRIYVETTMHDTKMGPTVTVVNVHYSCT